MASYLSIQPLKRGDRFPEIQGKTLSGQKIHLPHDLNGKPSILIIYFYRDTRVQVKPWNERLHEKYGKYKNVNCLEVPMFQDYARLYGFVLDRKLKQIIPHKRHENVAVYYGKLGKYYYHFDVNSLTDCYVYLLDASGKVRATAVGEFTEDKFEQITGTLETLYA